MKSKKVKTVIFIVICILSFFLLFIFISTDRNNKSSQNTPKSTDSFYTVSEYQGKIAVFRNSENIPIEIYDSYVVTLPEHDQKMLRKGIMANTGEELQKIIEDYTS